MKNKHQATRLVHADKKSNNLANGAVHEPTNNSVLFDFDDVADLEAIFQGKKAGHVYSRSSSGSAVALQNILNELDNGIGACVFATGMSAISSVMFALLKAGDHIVVSRHLFGNTVSYFEQLSGFGIEVSYTDTTDAETVKSKIKQNTVLVFCETIANPTTQVADLQGIGQLCQSNKILFIVDNTLTPSVMFNAHKVNASLLVTSLTKYTSGHGNALGGVVIDMGSFDWSSYKNIDPVYKEYPSEQWGMVQIRKKGLRDLGGTISAHAAHQISVGIETLDMRMRKACATALRLAIFFDEHPLISKVNYPGLKSHPEHERTKALFGIVDDEGQSQHCFGGLLSIELIDDVNPQVFLNSLKLVLRATHLGDNRTLALPVASTIFYENGAENRASMGISDNLIRISVGIENASDLIEDFSESLQSAKM